MWPLVGIHKCTTNVQADLFSILTHPARASRRVEVIFEYPLAKGHHLATMRREFATALLCSPAQLEASPYRGVDALEKCNTYSDDAPLPMESLWLSPQDVETYLARQGITIVPGTWFVRTKVRREILQGTTKSCQDRTVWSDAQRRNTTTLRPFWNSVLERYCRSEAYEGRHVQQGSIPVQNMTTSITPADSYLQSIGDFSRNPDSFTFQPNNPNWISTESEDNMDTFRGEIIPACHSSWPTMNVYSASFHEGAYSLPLPDPSASSQLNSITSSMPHEPQWPLPTYQTMHTPPLYTDTTKTVSTEQDLRDISPIDVTLNVKQLMSNLSMSVKCLGAAPGLREVDIIRALRASVQIHS